MFLQRLLLAHQYGFLGGVVISFNDGIEKRSQKSLQAQIDCFNLGALFNHHPRGRSGGRFLFRFDPGQHFLRPIRPQHIRFSNLQEKLNRLTRGYLDELIDEESYRASQADLVMEKTALKQEKQRLQKTGSSYWNEPAKVFINTLETAGKMQIEKFPQEISPVVHKVGTNRLISRKTVTFSFAEPYAFIPSLLASRHVTLATTTPSLGDENGGSIIWCA